MKEYDRYLSDEELEWMIAQVEEKEMIAPPVYLKEITFDKLYARKKNTVNRQLLLYSIKIMSAAAAAVFCLAAVPVNLQGAPLPFDTENSLERRIERDIERYKEEDKQLFTKETEDSAGFKGIFSDKSKEILKLLNND